MSHVWRRWLTLQRDLRRRLQGRPLSRPQQITQRPAPVRHPAPIPVQVVERIEETARAVSLVLQACDGRPLPFVPGMFVTLIVDIDGVEARRAYSLSGDHRHPERLMITVKKMEPGWVSAWLVDRLRCGDRLHLLAPEGRFTLQPQAQRQRQVLFIAAGSGITPIMAMLSALLAEEAQSQAQLFYANHAADEVIFAERLAALELHHGGRLQVRHALSQTSADGHGVCGRLDEARCRSWLQEAYGERLPQSLEVYMCGPLALMQSLRGVLLDHGVEANRLHQENYQPMRTRPTTGQSAHALEIVDSAGRCWSGQVLPGQSLLEAGLALGAPMQHSCALGGCGQCRLRVLQGEVDMPEPNGLLPSEREQGYSLACIAQARTPLRVLIDTAAVSAGFSV